MTKPVECLRCHVQMEIGYVADGTHAGYAQQQWSPGLPEKSFWTGLKMEAVVPVTTLRCPNCGYLESYAIPETIEK